MSRRHAQRSRRRDRAGSTAAGPKPDMLREATTSQGGLALLGIVLPALLAVACFAGTVSFDLLNWDDGMYVCDNPQINRVDGIHSIWFDVFAFADPSFDARGSGHPATNYYPMTLTSFWLDFRMLSWFGGADPGESVCNNIAAGRSTPRIFHAHNVLLHGFNAALVVLVLRRLGVSAAASLIAGLLFAAHPLQVASVAWVAERKNVLSMFFMLLTLLVYVDFRRTGKGWRYGLTLACFAAALFSKTIAITWPIVLFAADMLLARPISRQSIIRSLARITPMLLVALVAGLVTIKQELRGSGAESALMGFERMLLPAATVLYYPARAVWWGGQSPIVPQWHLDPTNWRWYACMLACIGILVAGLRYRRRISPYVWWSVAVYVIVVLPLLGLVNSNYFKYAFVADHFSYHGLFGLFSLAGLAGAWLLGRCTPRSLAWFGTMILIGGVVAFCGARTVRYAGVYRNTDAFMRHVLRQDPDRWVAYNLLTRAAIKDLETAAVAGDAARVATIYQEADLRADIGMARFAEALAPFRARIHTAAERGAHEEAIRSAQAAARRTAHAAEFHLAAIRLQQVAGHWPRARAMAADALLRFPTSAPLAAAIERMAREEHDLQVADACLRHVRRIQSIRGAADMARMLTFTPEGGKHW